MFLTSHDMGVVEKLWDRVAFINNGNILKVGSQNELAKLILDEINIEIGISKNKHKFKLEIEKENFLTNITDTRSGFIISIHNRTFYKNLFTILSIFEISKIKEKELSLEELFLKFNEKNLS
ncbi:hypothetical protein LCGC14_0676110 [marine sediment metagenome]|uniref:DUF4162 domain-containing protein n=1 Tax=marine sediment metagenome TaxID=412755 RepID=A0A0F9QPM4_9ZZZZ